MSKAKTPVVDTSFLGHPKGLMFLFFTEMWERFSYYGMRAMLVLYIATDLMKDRPDGEEIAYGIYGTYGSLVYLAPIIGGYFSDKILGHKNAVKLGAILMCLGHFAMAFPSEEIFYIALGLLIVGNGFFKPNISTIVGSLYPDGDNRREKGFTIFYMGVNLGAFLAPLGCGALAEAFGWHYGFAAAGVGMLIGYFVFELGLKKKLFAQGEGVLPEYKEKKYVGLGVVPFFYVATIIISCTLVALLVANGAWVIPGLDSELHHFLMTALLLFVLGYIIYLASKQPKAAAMKIAAIVCLTLFITVFWSFFEMSGGALATFAAKNVNLVGINAVQTQSINPFFIITLSIPISYFWTYLDKKRANPRTPIKSGLANILLGLGFVVFAYSGGFMNDEARVPMMFLILGYFILTVGELLISPIGLSKMTELSPKTMVAFFLGTFYLSSSLAHMVAGELSKMTIVDTSGDEYVSEEGFLNSYATSISGFDQNTVGEFNFLYTKDKQKIVDTARYTTEYKVETKGELMTVNATSHDKLVEKVDNLTGSKDFNVKDSSLVLNWDEMAYPSSTDLSAFYGRIDTMASIGGGWAKLSERLLTGREKVSSNFGALIAKSDTASLILYKNYTKSYMDVQTQKHATEAYGILLEKSGEKEGDRSEDKLDRDWNNIPKSYRKMAESLEADIAAMKAHDAEWAENAISYREGIESAHNEIQSFVGLAQYTKVFAYSGLFAILFGIFTLLISPFIKKLMQDVH